MKLQDVILKAMAKKISWLEAAEIAGVCDRTMRRMRESYRFTSGEPGIDLLIISARSHDPGGSEALFRETQAAVQQARGWHGWKWRIRLAQAQAELALARQSWDQAVDAASHVVIQSHSCNRPKYEALGLAAHARALGRLGLRRAGADAEASVQIARRLADPAVLLECLSVLLELDRSDELQSEAQCLVLRISGALSQEHLRRRFLASVSANRQLTLRVKENTVR